MPRVISSSFDNRDYERLAKKKALSRSRTRRSSAGRHIPRTKGWRVLLPAVEVVNAHKSGVVTAGGQKSRSAGAAGGGPDTPTLCGVARQAAGRVAVARSPAPAAGLGP